MTRAENRARMESAILRLGREQLKSKGPSDLSLREIARDLDVSSSAVYRYVNDRDELLTRLIVDAYSELAQDVEKRISNVEGADALKAYSRAMRDWATGNPARWGLIYGTPVPGYAAPAEDTNPAGISLLFLLSEIIGELPSAPDQPTGAYLDYLETAITELGVKLGPPQLAAAVRAWTTITGTISMEIFSQLGPEPADFGEQIMDAAVQGFLGSLSNP